MSYIVQVTLDKAGAIRHKIYGLYEWHKKAWDLFPNRSKENRDFLTRLDVKEQEFRFTVLATTKPQRPEWCPVECWKEKEIPPTFFQKKQYLFQIAVNPTRTLSQRDPKGNKKKHGSHHAITKADELKTWFLSKAKQYGFSILDEPKLEISPPVFQKLYKKNDEGVLIGVEFKGGLKVTDRTKFMEAVHKGIGRARAFGFGMLIVKPIA